MKKCRSFILTLLVSLVSMTMYAQDFVCTGTIVDDAGEPIIGASIFQKGSTKGAVSDFNGEFKLAQVPEGSVITISYIGYKTVETKAASGMHIVMHEDNATLNELVVVGYGVQKKSVVTASIAKVGADELGMTAPVRMDNALKGLAAGVPGTSSSGQPGAAAQIRVRGIGTINNSDPLYIVDGMPIEGGLDYVNPSDIESIEVLKDAASGAIYGARAANGVVLVTTKSGKKGKVKVNYNFSYGWQSKWHKRDVLNATEYAVMMNEGYINAGMEPLYDDPYNLTDAMGNKITTGTDWQDELFNDNAPVVNHDITVSGASDKVNYYLSLGYYAQEGIIGGNFDRSNYQRLSLRSNTKYNVFDVSKERNWLNKLDITVNLSYARVKSKSIEVNSQFGSPLGSALALSPILTPTLTGDAAIAQDEFYRQTQPDYPGPILSPNGDPYTIAGTTYNEMVNPLAALSLPGAQNWSHKFVTNFAAELQIWDGLKYRISYGTDMSFWGNEGHTILYYLTTNNKATHTSASQESDRGTVWQIENVLTYDKTFGDHTFNVVLGQSAMKNTGWTLGASRNYHRWARKHGMVYGSDKPHDVLLNSWEGVYFDVYEPKMDEMMRDFAAIGGEMFVMDDGWFGTKYKRNNDKGALGDWIVDTTKLPNGIQGLVNTADKYGLKFGIWIEPEATNVESVLYEKHPDWALNVKGRNQHYGRGGGQMLLDLCNPEVQDFIYNMVDTLLTNYPGIAYIKWDANVELKNYGSSYLPADKQSHIYIDYHRGLVNVLKRIRTKHPDVVIQACGGGGGRVSYGVMPYFDEFWVSDNTDALQRIYIQWGTSYFYPANAMAQHVSASPNHQTGRVVPLKFRFDVAMSGRLGMEMQPGSMSEKEREYAKKTIAEYKEILRPIVQQGNLYRLVSPYDRKGYASLMYANDDASRAIVFAYKMEHFNNMLVPRLRLDGLDASRTYEFRELSVPVGENPSHLNGKRIKGAILMNTGFEIPLDREYSSRVYELVAVD